MSRESAGQQGGSTGPDLANPVLGVVCIVSVVGWGIDEGLPAQGWSWLGHFSCAAFSDPSRPGFFSRLWQGSKKKKVGTHKNFFKPSQKSHSQAQGHNGKGLQSCRAKGVGNRSHWFGPLMQSVYHRVDTFILLFVNTTGAGNGKSPHPRAIFFFSPMGKERLISKRKEVSISTGGMRKLKSIFNRSVKIWREHSPGTYKELANITGSLNEVETICFWWQ